MRLVIYYISYLIRLVVNLWQSRNDDYVTSHKLGEMRRNVREI